MIIENKVEHKKAFDLWIEFLNEITNNNRYFPKGEMETYLDKICFMYSTNITKNTIFYRARIMTDKDRYLNIQNKPPFLGYNKKESHMPPQSIAVDGRANVNGMCCLYVACEEETALIEVRPIIDNYVSIAKIKLIADLRCIDLTIDNVYGETLIYHEMKNYIEHWFSMPLQHYEKNEYIPTQYIASYIKHLDYDAIKYKSSLNPNGNNIVIFDGKKASPISSRLLLVNGMGISSVSIGNEEGKDIKLSIT